VVSLTSLPHPGHEIDAMRLSACCASRPSRSAKRRRH